jgi:hypothetical protein
LLFVNGLTAISASSLFGPLEPGQPIIVKVIRSFACRQTNAHRRLTCQLVAVGDARLGILHSFGRIHPCFTAIEAKKPRAVP